MAGYTCGLCKVWMPEKDKVRHKCDSEVIRRNIEDEEKLKKEIVAMEEKHLIEQQNRQPAILALMESPEKAVAMYDDIKKNFLRLLKDNGEVIKVKGKDYVKYEGWQTIGTALGVLPRIVEITKNDGFYQAKAEAILVKTGAVIGSAYGICSREEANWKDKPEYAVMAMAQTRAAGRALKMILSGFIAHCGFEATPAEEVIDMGEPIRHERTEEINPDGSKDVTYTEKPPKTILISDAQRKRLYAIGKESGMPADFFKDWLQKSYGITDTKDIQREYYDDICRFVQGYKK
jgi:hypothetical protein